MKIVLLVRAYCHVCEKMLADLQPIVEAHGAVLEVIDVDSPGNTALEAEWGDRVPAVFAGEPGTGALLCHYHLDQARVLSALRGAPAPG